jgi:hypothetical protein
MTLILHTVKQVSEVEFTIAVAVVVVATYPDTSSILLCLICLNLGMALGINVSKGAVSWANVALCPVGKSVCPNTNTPLQPRLTTMFKERASKPALTLQTALCPLRLAYWHFVLQ